MGCGDHRFGQHRHRPDDQGAAPLREADDGGDGRHRSRVGRAAASRANGRRHHRRRGRRTAVDARVRRCASRVRRHLGRSTLRELDEAATDRCANARPHARRDRALLRAGREPRRPSRRTQPEHGHLWWPGDGADRGSGQPCRSRVVCRDRVVDRFEVGRPGYPCQHRRVHRDHGTSARSRGRREREARP